VQFSALLTSRYYFLCMCCFIYVVYANKIMMMMTILIMIRMTKVFRPMVTSCNNITLCFFSN